MQLSIAEILAKLQTSAVNIAKHQQQKAGTAPLAVLTNALTNEARTTTAVCCCLADYAPFNIDVTTNPIPDTVPYETYARVIIGGAGQWYGQAGGVSYVSMAAVLLLAPFHGKGICT
jgi:hypothetical protein